MEYLIANPNDWFSSILLDSMVKSLALLLLAGLLVLIMRRASASLRHLVWVLAMGGMLVLPFLSVVLPAWQILLPSHAQLTPAVASTMSIAPQHPMPWSLIVVVLWGSGAILLIVQLLLDLVRLRRYLREATPLTTGVLFDELQGAATRFAIRRAPVLFISGRIGVPMIWGVLTPMVVLPAEAEAWPIERCRMVFLHELAHFKRGDCLMQMLARLTCALYWCNPLVWVAASALRAESERACDDRILNLGCKGSEYAGHLLDIAREMHGRAAAPAAAVAMARTTKLAERVTALLDVRANRYAVTPVSATVAVLCCAVLVLPLAVMQATAQQSALPGAESLPRTRVMEKAPTVVHDGHIRHTTTGENARPARMTTTAVARTVGAPPKVLPAVIPQNTRPMSPAQRVEQVPPAPTPVVKPQEGMAQTSPKVAVQQPAPNPTVNQQQVSGPQQAYAVHVQPIPSTQLPLAQRQQQTDDIQQPDATQN